MVEAKGEDKEEGGGYICWKPVIYKAPNTHALNSSSTTQYDIHDHSNVNDWINTPLYRLYGNEIIIDKSPHLKKSFNVSFGEPNDGFYAKSNYLYW